MTSIFVHEAHSLPTSQQTTRPFSFRIFSPSGPGTRSDRPAKGTDDGGTPLTPGLRGVTPIPRTEKAHLHTHARTRRVEYERADPWEPSQTRTQRGESHSADRPLFPTASLGPNLRKKKKKQQKEGGKLGQSKKPASGRGLPSDGRSGFLSRQGPVGKGEQTSRATTLATSAFFKAGPVRQATLPNWTIASQRPAAVRTGVG